MSAAIQACTRAVVVAKAHGIRRLRININNKFVVNVMTRWVDQWRARGWRKADGEPVENEVDVRELDRECNDGDIEIEWVSDDF